MPREKINREQIDLSELGENLDLQAKKEKKSLTEKNVSEKHVEDKAKRNNVVQQDSDDEEDFFDQEFQFVGDEEIDEYKDDLHKETKLAEDRNSTKKKTNTKKTTSGKDASNKSTSNKGKKTTKKKRISPWAILGIFIFIVLLIVGTCYGAGAYYYSSHFLRGTVINGIDVSNMTYDELASTLKSYSIVVKQRGMSANSQYVEKIKGSEIGIDLLSDSGVEAVLDNQSLLEWYAVSGKTYEHDTLISFDEELLEEKILTLKGFQKGQFEKPKSADISEYDSQKGFSIVSETQGNELKKKVTIEVIKEAVINLTKEVDLDKNDCYKKPKVDSGNNKLNDIVNTMNKMAKVKITYTFDSTVETLDGSMISEWLIVDRENNTVTLDRDKVSEFVATLRKKYDTIFRSRDFKTKSGKTVTLDNGDYGWWMNYVEEAKQLGDQIEAGKSGKRTPVYFQTAAQYGSKDYGNSYVEINLTSQKLFVFVNGKVKLKTDICSGNTSLKRGTHTGVFGITYKERYGVLVGETYESTVAYWMPFDGDIGLHDAIWKTQFGSNFYKTAGSHGCINLPYNTAKKIYGLVEKNTPVIVYELPGTESDSVTIQSYKEIANAAIEAIDAIGKVTKNSEDDIKTARYMYNKVGASGRKYVTNYDVLVKAEEDFKSIS